MKQYFKIFNRSPTSNRGQKILFISIFVNLEHPSHSDASFTPNLFLKAYKKYDSIFNFVTHFGFTSKK